MCFWEEQWQQNVLLDLLFRARWCCEEWDSEEGKEAQMNMVFASLIVCFSFLLNKRSQMLVEVL